MGNSIFGGGSSGQNANKSTIYATIQTKACTVLKCSSNIVKRTIKFTQDIQSPNHYYLNFNYWSLNPVFFTVYYCVKEIVEEATQLNKGFNSLKESLPKPICYKCVAGENVEFPQKVSYIDIAQFEQNELTESIDNYYPVVLRIEDSQETKSKYVMFIYGSFILNKGVYEFKLLKQKLENENRVYDISDIYGIDQTQFNKEWNMASDGDRECTICCTEKNDTILLPCKHMCLCKECSENLKKDSRKCPICRYEIELCLTIDLQKKKNKDLLIEEGSIIPEEIKSNEKVIQGREMLNPPNYVLNMNE